MSQHKYYHFSITVKTDIKSVLYCLRALSMYAQKTGLKMIPWGGQTDKKWEKSNHQVTFYFTSEEYRNSFVVEARKLLPESWEIIEKRDDNSPILQ